MPEIYEEFPGGMLTYGLFSSASVIYNLSDTLMSALVIYPPYSTLVPYMRPAYKVPLRPCPLTNGTMPYKTPHDSKRTVRTEYMRRLTKPI